MIKPGLPMTHLQALAAACLTNALVWILAWGLSPKAYQCSRVLQNRAFGNLFKSPNMLEDVAVITQKLERGDLKLRVRALEAERALGRVQVQVLLSHMRVHVLCLCQHP